MRRSRWYSANPNSNPLDLLAHARLGLIDRTDRAQIGGGQLAKEPECGGRHRTGAGLRAAGADGAALIGREQLWIRLAANGAGRERRVEARERKQLQHERFGHGRGFGRKGVKRAHPGQQQDRDPDVALVLLGDLVDRFQHGLAGGRRRQVVPQVLVRRDDLGLGDGVQLPAAPVQHQRDVGERLKAGHRTGWWSCGCPWPPPGPCPNRGS